MDSLSSYPLKKIKITKKKKKRAPILYFLTGWRHFKMSFSRAANHCK